MDNILKEIGIANYTGITEIIGGKDSSVCRIDTPDGTYALRLLPEGRVSQFKHEAAMIDIALRHGVPVPKVRRVTSAGGRAVMLMEWADGRTMLEELKSHPENAEKLGFAFGRQQAAIHEVQLAPLSAIQPWLAPDLREEETLRVIPKEEMAHNLLHLDYHLMNVMTDGEKITAVIDWANAGIDDRRLDFARTASILPLIAYIYFKGSPKVIIEFKAGWNAGYLDSAEPLERMETFHEWAQLRTKRDLVGRLSEAEYDFIQQWWTNNKKVL